ncbi:DUF3515 domain-containing protein [Nocardioides gilvus]|uniref:DUF3515 domain-containing protein n=1 Tax=Nocardioides gilvus TaxID=1735589 RepID=UPI0013A54E84|nr:DUF3515 domain-containing protein [Nocardioides gilvus]
MTRSSRRLRGTLLRHALAAPVVILTVAVLSACSSDVEITSTPMDQEVIDACTALVNDLPDDFFASERREVTGEGIGAAWGEPPVVLTCSAPAPEEFDAFSRCSDIEGVGWFIPDAELKDPERDLVMSAQSHAPRVSLSIPAERRTDAPDTYLRTIAPLIIEHLTETSPCL